MDPVFKPIIRSFRNRQVLDHVKDKDNVVFLDEFFVSQYPHLLTGRTVVGVDRDGFFRLVTQDPNT